MPISPTRGATGSGANPGWRREESLWRWWSALPAGSRLSTIDGRSLHVLSPGTFNLMEGPDFKGVRLLVNGIPMTGDLECHLNERDWIAHGHASDGNFSRVIVHLIAHRASSRITGVAPPLTVLAPERTLAASPGVLCRLTHAVPPERVLAALKPLAFGRWCEMVQRMVTSIQSAESLEEAFYRESFRALGLKGNEEPFADLARAIPLSSLAGAVGIEELEQFFFAVAGIVQGRVGDPAEKAGSGQNISNHLEQQLHTRARFSHRWRRKSIRPAGRPEMRLGIGVALARELLGGWTPWTDPPSKLRAIAASRLANRRPGGDWLTEWCGNVALPFQEAAASACSQLVSSERFDAWYSLPIQTVYGDLERRYGAYLPRPALRKFGCRQALLSYRNRYCELALCDWCLLRDTDAGPRS